MIDAFFAAARAGDLAALVGAARPRGGAAHRRVRRRAGGAARRRRRVGGRRGRARARTRSSSPVLVNGAAGRADHAARPAGRADGLHRRRRPDHRGRRHHRPAPRCGAWSGSSRGRAGRRLRCHADPDDEEILALHQRHAPTPEALDLVYTHCQIVAAVAEQLLARPASPPTPALVRAGCLLHDVGVYPLYDAAGRLDHAQYIRHGVLGYELLRAAGLPEVICRFASHHTGVGPDQGRRAAAGAAAAARRLPGRHRRGDRGDVRGQVPHQEHAARPSSPPTRTPPACAGSARTRRPPSRRCGRRSGNRTWRRSPPPTGSA